jgi:hypothetical protein
MNNVVALRPNLAPPTKIQPLTKKTIEQRRMIRELSSRLRELRNAQRATKPRN